MLKCGRFGQATDDNVLRGMRFTCWVNKTTGIRSEYVIEFFHGHSGYANVFHCYLYTYIACLYILHTIWISPYAPSGKRHTLGNDRLLQNYGFSLWNLFHSNLLAPRMWRSLIDFWKFVNPQVKSILRPYVIHLFTPWRCRGFTLTSDCKGEEVSLVQWCGISVTVGSQTRLICWRTTKILVI